MSAWAGVFSAGGGAPTSPVAGYTAWYDAADTGSLTITSNKVSQWNDLSANNHDLTQGTAGSRPLYNSSPRTMNGVTIPEFTGAGEFMESTCPMDDRTFTFFFAGYADAFNATPIGDTQGGGCEMRVDSSARLSILKSGVLLLANSDPFNIPGNTTFVGGVRLSATDIDFYSPGGRVDTSAEATTFTAGRTLKIGVDTSGTVPWNGLIAELIFYTTTLSDPDVQECMNYMVGKWMVTS